MEEVVDCLRKSTDAYLALLMQTNQGEERMEASDIEKTPDEVEVINNSKWHGYKCRLPSGKRILADTYAEIIEGSFPGKRLAAQIVAYDYRTGQANIAVESPLSTRVATLIIDFKWIVRRVLNWIEKHGASIRLPESRSSASSFNFQSSANLDQDQAVAVAGIFANPLTYIWGPPGTGKTRHILATAAVALATQERRVLIAAPTNLAVDNALDAVLSTGDVSVTDVLRVGVPSDGFRKKWSGACEKSAFRAELKSLTLRASQLREQLARDDRFRELKGLVEVERERESEERRKLDQLSQDLGPIAAKRNGILADLDKISNEKRKLEAELAELSHEYKELGVENAINAISVLEREYTELLAKTQKLKDEIEARPWWGRLFFSKRKELEKSLSQLQQRVLTLETTLLSQRQLTASKREHGLVLNKRHAEIQRKLSDLQQSLSAQRLALDIDREAYNIKKRAVDFAGLRVANSAAKLANHLSELESCGEHDSREWSDDDRRAAEQELFALDTEIAKVEPDISKKLILGMTLDAFVGLTMNQALAVDHVFVDEAGYAPLAKVFPLLSRACPITLLGDHKQLPPIYQGKNDPESKAFWGSSALYIEEAVALNGNADAILKAGNQGPRFRKLVRFVLTTSHRFGAELAALLDKYFYEKVGLQGTATSNMTIEMVDCPPLSQPRKKRTNLSECLTILERVEHWLVWRANHRGSLGIITPYKNQETLIRKALRKRFVHHPLFSEIEVLTIHKAQGREWDTVFLSACDTARVPENTPFLANTACPDGALVINTAISRTRQHLRIFLDMSFWRNFGGPNLLTELCG